MPGPPPIGGRGPWAARCDSSSWKRSTPVAVMLEASTPRDPLGRLPGPGSGTPERSRASERATSRRPAPAMAALARRLTCVRESMPAARVTGQDAWYHSCEGARIMRRAFLVLILIALVALGLWIWLIGRPASESQQARPPDTSGAALPRSIPTSVAAAQPTPRPTPLPTPGPRDMVTEVTESEMQDQLIRMRVGKSPGTPPRGDATAQPVSVALRAGQTPVAGNAKAGVLPAPFTAAGAVAPDPAGRPKVRIEEATVG